MIALHLISEHLKAFKGFWHGMFVILLFYLISSSFSLTNHFIISSFIIVIVSKCENSSQNIFFSIYVATVVKIHESNIQRLWQRMCLMAFVLFLDKWRTDCENWWSGWSSQHLTMSSFKQKSLSKVTPRRQGLTSAGLPPQLHHQPGSHDSPCITPYLWQPCAV